MFILNRLELVSEKTNVAVGILMNQVFAEHMVNNLINDLLDLSKLENNHFRLNSEYFNLPVLVHEALSMVLHSAEQQ